MPSTFVPCDNVAEFAVVQTLYDQKVINTFHLYNVDGWSLSALEAACDALILAYNDNIASHQSTDIAYNKVMARDLTTVSGFVFEKNFPPSSGGDDAHTSLPAQNAYSVAHTTSRAGRSFRGRTSIAGLPENHIDGNIVDAFWATGLVEIMSTVQTNLAGHGFIWGVVSKYSGYTQTAPKYKKVPTPRAAGIFTAITGHAGSLRIGSQDSRNK